MRDNTYEKLEESIIGDIERGNTNPRRSFIDHRVPFSKGGKQMRQCVKERTDQEKWGCKKLTKWTG